MRLAGLGDEGQTLGGARESLLARKGPGDDDEQAEIAPLWPQFLREFDHVQPVDGKLVWDEGLLLSS